MQHTRVVRRVRTQQDAPMVNLAMQISHATQTRQELRHLFLHLLLHQLINFVVVQCLMLRVHVGSRVRMEMGTAVEDFLVLIRLHSQNQEQHVRIQTTQVPITSFAVLRGATQHIHARLLALVDRMMSAQVIQTTVMPIYLVWLEVVHHRMYNLFRLSSQSTAVIRLKRLQTYVGSLVRMMVIAVQDKLVIRT